MEHLIRAVQARLKQRKLYRPAVGLVVKEICKPFAVDPKGLYIKIAWRKCTIILSSQEDKTSRFLKKAELLERINKKLAHDGREVQFDEVRIQ
jgi:hypothetical protein